MRESERERDRERGVEWNKDLIIELKNEESYNQGQ